MTFGSLTIYTSPSGAPTLCLTGYGGACFITDSDEVAYFDEVLDSAGRVALSPTDSIAYVREMARSWETRQ